MLSAERLQITGWSTYLYDYVQHSRLHIGRRRGVKGTAVNFRLESCQRSTCEQKVRDFLAHVLFADYHAFAELWAFVPKEEKIRFSVYSAARITHDNAIWTLM